jgi:MoaA/NifB/PqqE/SkfB family radical SAM enzyme
LLDKGIIDEGTTIELSGSEITVHPQSKEILAAVSSFNSIVMSSCIKFSEELAEIIAGPSSLLCASIDSGTRETYEKIKGVDAFEKVSENLKRYAELGGNIHMKYIVLPENTTEADLKGFLELCKEIKCKQIRISCDIKVDHSSLPQALVDFAIRLGRFAVSDRFEVVLLPHFGAKNDEIIKEQVFDIKSNERQ